MAIQNVLSVVNSVADDGRPMRLFPFPADFNKDVIEAWEWKTDIITSFNNTEQRQCLRYRPRRSYEFSVMISREERSLFENLMWAHQKGVWGVPMWHKPSVTSVAYAAGEVLFTPDKVQDYAGDYAVFFISPTQYEMVRLLHADGGVTLATPLVNTWPAGTFTFPVYAAKMKDNVDMASKLATLAAGSLSFSLLSCPSPYAGVPYPELSPEVLVSGYRVLEYPHDWSAEVSGTFGIKAEMHDSGITDPTWEIEGSRPYVVQPHRFFLDSVSRIDQFLGLMDALKGRFLEFFLPSQKEDFKVLAYRNGDNPYKLLVKFCGFTDLVSASSQGLPGRNRVRIEFSDGVVSYKRITGSVATEAGEELTLASALPEGYSAGDIRLVSFLSIARLDSDRVELLYKSPRFAVAATTIKTTNRIV